MAAKTTPLRFDIYQGGSLVQSVTLDETPIKIGKLPSSHLRIDDENVSRIHAVIEPARDEGFHIIDLGSSSGTFVNGAKVNKQKLSSGDEIRLGDTVVRFMVLEASAGLDEGATQVSSIGALQSAAAPASHPGALAGSSAQAEVYAGGGLGMGAANPLAAPGLPNPLAAGLPNPLAAGFPNPLAAAPGAPSPFGMAQSQMPSSPFGLPQPQAMAAPVMAAAPGATAQPMGGGAAAARRRKRRDDFERRFLSERYKGGTGALEVALLWRGNLFHIDQYKKAAELTIGSSSEATYAVESDSLGPSRPLASFDGQQVTFSYTDDMDGFVLVDPARNNGKEKVPLREAVARGIARKQGSENVITMDGNTRIKLVIGDVVVLAHFVSLPNIAIPLIGGAAGLGAAAYASLVVLLVAMGLSGVLHGVFGAMVALSTDRVGDLSIDTLLSDSRFGDALVTDILEEEEELEEEEDNEEDAPAEEEGAKAAEEEGDVGKPDETAMEGKFAIAGESENMALQKAHDMAVANNAGLLASSETMSSLLGTGMTAEGFDAVNAWGEFDSTAAAGNTAGNYGLGMTGAGRGGGGTNTGGFGVGNFGTAGRGGGGSGGRDYGRGEGKLGDKAIGQPKLKPGRPDVSGSLDKKIIRKVVNQHKREIKACYEKELSKKKGLHGKIVVAWIIDTSGNVPSATVSSNSMGDNNVASCLTNSVKHWRFPAPKGGGLVKVSYPFVFEVGN